MSVRLAMFINAVVVGAAVGISTRGHDTVACVLAIVLINIVAAHTKHEETA